MPSKSIIFWWMCVCAVGGWYILDFTGSQNRPIEIRPLDVVHRDAAAHPPGYDPAPQPPNLSIWGPEQQLVRASIDPIEFTLFGLHREWDALANLPPVAFERLHPISVFQGFLPDKKVAVGGTWSIRREAVMALLKQLAARPKLRLHINPSATREADGHWAVLRAIGDQAAEIVFRIHAEFALADGFFTPAQFSGRLVIDRSSHELIAFEMFVPPSTLNFDVNWKDGTDNGFCQIGLEAGADNSFGMIFDEEISPLQADLLLAERFYRAQQIHWVTLDQAARLAASQGKPIHIVAADGNFMDESC